MRKRAPERLLLFASRELSTTDLGVMLLGSTTALGLIVIATVFKSLPVAVFSGLIAVATGVWAGLRFRRARRP